VEPAAAALGRQEGEAAQQLELRAQRDLTILEVTRTARHLAEIDLQLEEANRFARGCFVFSDFFTHSAIVANSVAESGCLSRIRIFSIPDPNIFHHPGSASNNSSIY
jgi:hypothetical protein